MPRLNIDTWTVVRSEYESDPTASFGILAEKFGVHRSSIHQRAKKEGWQKAGETASINDAAYRRADNATDETDKDLHKTDTSIALKTIATREKSEEKRANIIVLHRQEWQELNNFRKAALVKMKEALESGDKQKWWNAKIASDTSLHHMRSLEIKQQGERRAWGLEQSQQQTQQPAPKPLLEIK